VRDFRAERANEQVESGLADNIPSPRPDAKDQPPGRPSEKALDLMALIDPERDAVAGRWRWQDGCLLSERVDFARLEVPRSVPDNYRLTLVVEPRGTSGEFYIGLPISMGQVLLAIDAFGDEAAALFSMDGPLAHDRSPAKGRTFRTDQPNEISCVVRGGNVTVSCNGETCVKWSGRNPQALPIEWQIKYPNHLMIGGANEHRIAGMWLEDLGNAERAAHAPQLATRKDADPLKDQEPLQGSLDGTVSAEAKELLRHAVAWYRAEGNADDSAGKHNGKLEGGAAITPIAVGHAFDFDGKEASVVVPNANDLNPRGPFTVMAWIRPRAARKTDSLILSKINSATGASGYELGVAPENASLFVSFNAVGEPRRANTLVWLPRPLAADEWVHVAGTYDGDDLHLYLNGAAISKWHCGAKVVAPSAARLRISGDDDGDLCFDGLIDDVAFFEGRAASSGGKRWQLALHSYPAARWLANRRLRRFFVDGCSSRLWEWIQTGVCHPNRVGNIRHLAAADL
jgi:hypothetical protein